MQLDGPLAFLDLESTGLDVATDRIVEVAVLRLAPDAQPVRFRSLVDPGVPIPEAAVAIHGIDDATIAGEPRFAEIAPRLSRLLEGCDLAGFNLVGYDLPLLVAEFRRAGVEFAVAGRAVLDAKRIYHRFEPRDLAAAVRHYCGRAHEAAHSALADAEAAAAVLDAQLNRHAELPPTPAELHAFLTEVDIAGKFRREGRRIFFNFGKHHGRRLRDVARSDPGYLRWMLEQDFLDDVRLLVERALERAGQGG
jgi:DNA polymerase-3 subunit epsilon